MQTEQLISLTLKDGVVVSTNPVPVAEIRAWQFCRRQIDALDSRVREMYETGTQPDGVPQEGFLPLLLEQLGDAEFRRALGEVMKEFLGAGPEDRRSRKIFVRYVYPDEYKKWVESPGGQNGRLISTFVAGMEFKSMADAADALGITPQYLRQLFSAMRRNTRDVESYENKCVRVRGVALAFEDDYWEALERGQFI
jgi:hypothetical protein